MRRSTRLSAHQKPLLASDTRPVVSSTSNIATKTPNIPATLSIVKTEPRLARFQFFELPVEARHKIYDYYYADVNLVLEFYERAVQFRYERKRVVKGPVGTRVHGGPDPALLLVSMDVHNEVIELYRQKVNTLTIVNEYQYAECLTRSGLSDHRDLLNRLVTLTLKTEFIPQVMNWSSILRYCPNLRNVCVIVSEYHKDYMSDRFAQLNVDSVYGKYHLVYVENWLDDCNFIDLPWLLESQGVEDHSVKVIYQEIWRSSTDKRLPKSADRDRDGDSDSDDDDDDYADELMKFSCEFAVTPDECELVSRNCRLKSQHLKIRWSKGLPRPIFSYDKSNIWTQLHFKENSKSYNFDHECQSLPEPVEP